MPIKGLSEQKRLPRLGKIHLGVKKQKKNPQGEVISEYPTATDYFVCPPEVQRVYGKTPQKLDVIIPLEDEEMWASQYYKRYSGTRGLLCKGDGITCLRKLDRATGDIVNQETKDAVWKEGIPCEGQNCPDYQKGLCSEVLNLQFFLPKVPGLGVWQIDSGSKNSIRNINNCALMIRTICGKINWIPLVLTLEPMEVINPNDGKKKIVRCLNLRHEQGLQELFLASGKAKEALLIVAPAEDEKPSDIEEKMVDIEEKMVESVIIGNKTITEPKAEPAPLFTKETEVSPIDPTWLKETVTKAQLKNKEAVAWLVEKFKVHPGESLTKTLESITKEQQEAFCAMLRERAEVG